MVLSKPWKVIFQVRQWLKPCSKEAKLEGKEGITMWTKPAATEMRFGFEVTMYVCNR